jgi:hypothetical protein
MWLANGLMKTRSHDSGPSCAICVQLPLGRAADVELDVDQGTSLAG